MYTCEGCDRFKVFETRVCDICDAGVCSFCHWLFRSIVYEHKDLSEGVLCMSCFGNLQLRPVSQIFHPIKYYQSTIVSITKIPKVLINIVFSYQFDEYGHNFIRVTNDRKKIVVLRKKNSCIKNSPRRKNKNRKRNGLLTRWGYL